MHSLQEQYKEMNLSLSYHIYQSFESTISLIRFISVQWFKEKKRDKIQSPDQLFPKTESLPRPVPVELSPRKDLSFPIESICKPCTGAFFLVLPRGLSVTNTDHFSREKVKQSSQSFRGKPNSVGEEATMFAPIFRLLVCSVARNKRKPDCGGRCTFVRLGT